MHYFTKDQLNQIKTRGISLEEINNQLLLFRQGIEPVKLLKPAIPGDGIEIFSEEEINEYIRVYREGKHQYSIVKFIPASGAASRMFKELIEALYDLRNNKNKPDMIYEKFPVLIRFFNELEKYPFYNDLKLTCERNGTELQQLVSEKKYVEILDFLLNPSGLNYGALPKGLLKFHSYGIQFRTPLQEHLVEASAYVKGKSGQINLHFTVSKEHRRLFEEHIGQLLKHDDKFGITDYKISFSEQKPSTDTLAVTLDNEPFLIRENSLLFRPGGHGALIENLQDIEYSLIFIGNIDNVSPDRLKPLRIKYKELLGGVLIQRVHKIHTFLRELEKGISTEMKREIIDFVNEFISSEKAEKLHFLGDNDFIHKAVEALNKPVRVCGMVKNTGEPGGGPFWIENAAGGITKQIIESSQIDFTNPKQKQIFNSSTHFNPVDLVCFIQDFWGHKFNLKEFIDPGMAFIAVKSHGGIGLKALELPGLWNGAMAGWISFFVEVPGETFSPVKTVFDLLRPEHV